jgi:hypothetical protein
MRSQKYNPRVSGMYRRNVSASYVLASETFSGLRCQLGDKAKLLLNKKQYLDLLNLEVKPSLYDDPYSFRDDYLVSSLLSKYPLFDMDVDREKVALDKFIESEAHCSAANKRIGKYVSSSKSLYTIESVISLARLKIQSLLGPFSWDEAEQHFSFGPGSTTSLPRRKGDAYFKFGAVRPHVTKGCSVLASQLPRG